MHIHTRELRQGALTTQSRTDDNDHRRDTTRSNRLWRSGIMYVSPGGSVCGTEPRLMSIDFFTFSLMAFAFFPLVTRSLGDRPHAVERLTRGYLAILAICDVKPCIPNST